MVRYGYRSRYNNRRRTNRYSAYRPRRMYGSKTNGRYRNNQIRTYANRITKTRIPSTMIADRTFVKLSLSRLITIPFVTNEAYASLRLGGNYFSVGTNEGYFLPPGVTQWSQFYQCYRIMGSSIKIVPYPSDNYLPGTFYGILPLKNYGTNGAAGLNYDSVNAQPLARYRIGYTSGSSPKDQIIKHSILTKKMMGQRVTQEENFQGTWSWDSSTQEVAVVNPASTWDYHIYLGRVSAASTPSFSFYVTQNYYIRLEDRRGVDAPEEDDAD